MCYNSQSFHKKIFLGLIQTPLKFKHSFSERHKKLDRCFNDVLRKTLNLSWKATCIFYFANMALLQLHHELRKKRGTMSVESIHLLLLILKKGLLNATYGVARLFLHFWLRFLHVLTNIPSGFRCWAPVRIFTFLLLSDCPYDV